MLTANDIRILQAEYNSDKHKTKAQTIVNQISGFVKDTKSQEMELSYVLEEPVIKILESNGFVVKSIRRGKISGDGFLSHRNHTVISWAGEIKKTETN